MHPYLRATRTELSSGALMVRSGIISALTNSSISLFSLSSYGLLSSAPTQPQTRAFTSSSSAWKQEPCFGEMELGFIWFPSGG